MKKMVLALSLFFSAVAFTNAEAQVNINISAQPTWGPVGYDYVNYYYLPDIDVYYEVPRHRFVHINPAGKVVYSNGLPHAYRNYDLYNGYKVVINQPYAYKYHKDHKVKYASYKGKKDQAIIKNSTDPKYKVKAKSTVQPKGKAQVKTKANKNH